MWGDGLISRRIERICTIVPQIAKRFEKSVFSEANESGIKYKYKIRGRIE